MTKTEQLEEAASRALDRIGTKGEAIEVAAEVVAEDYADVTAEEVVAYLQGR